MKQDFHGPGIWSDHHFHTFLSSSTSIIGFLCLKQLVLGRDFRSLRSFILGMSMIMLCILTNYKKNNLTYNFITLWMHGMCPYGKPVELDMWGSGVGAVWIGVVCPLVRDFQSLLHCQDGRFLLN